MLTLSPLGPEAWAGLDFVSGGCPEGDKWRAGLLSGQLALECAPSPLRAPCVPTEAPLGTHLWEGEPHFSQGQSELAGATQSARAGCGVGLQASTPSQVAGRRDQRP